MLTIAVLGGDGIGPDVARSAVAVIKDFRLGIDFDYIDGVSANRFVKFGTIITDDELGRLECANAILFGAVGDPRVTTSDYAGGVILRLRHELDLFLNLRPARLLHRRLSPLRRGKHRMIDLVVVRENTEGLYAGVGGSVREGSSHEIAIDEEINTYLGVSRVIEHSFSIARTEVCMVDKSNAVRCGGRLWQRCWREAGERYPEIARRHLYADSAAMKLVEDPASFDVLVTNNSYGDILSDLAAVMAGGIGLAASANINPETRHALFEPVHGSAPDIAGQNVANPIGAILSSAMLLDFLGFIEEGAAVCSAVERVVAAGKCTRDIGGVLSTSEAGEAIRFELNRSVGSTRSD